VEILQSGVLDGLTTIQPYDVHLDSQANKDFIARYKKMFNSLPNLTSWVSYETVQVIAAAIRQAGSADPARLRDALAAGTFHTIFGDPIRFDDHNLAHLDALILGIQKGKVVLLGKSPT
jgi:branched-chain amino acid transport system substrate-binding protein